MKKYVPPLKTEQDLPCANESTTSSSKRPILKAPFLESLPEKDYYYFEFLHSFKDLKEIIEITFTSLLNVVEPHQQRDLTDGKRAILDRLIAHRNTLYRHAHYFKKMQRKAPSKQHQDI